MSWRATPVASHSSHPHHPLPIPFFVSSISCVVLLLALESGVPMWASWSIASLAPPPLSCRSSRWLLLEPPEGARVGGVSPRSLNEHVSTLRRCCQGGHLTAYLPSLSRNFIVFNMWGEHRELCFPERVARNGACAASCSGVPSANARPVRGPSSFSPSLLPSPSPSPSLVSVMTGTRCEGMGWAGRGEMIGGLSCSLSLESFFARFFGLLVSVLVFLGNQFVLLLIISYLYLIKKT